jgi:DNA-binding response OmpR family regulator
VTKSFTGQLLVERGAVSAEAVEKAIEAGRRNGLRLCSQLLLQGACDEKVLAAVLAEKHGFPGVDLSRTVVPLEVLELIPHAVAEADAILPLSLEGGRLHLAMASPREGEKVTDEVRFVTGREVSPYVAVRSALMSAIAGAYRARQKGEPLWRGAAAGDGPAHLEAALPPPVEALPEEVEGGEVIEVEEMDVEPLPEEGESTREVPLAAPVAVAAAPAGRRVVVVDDEPEIRLLLERTLTGKGYAVETAADGEEAMAVITSHPPDLVLLDAMLPRIHGFEVCRKLRSDRRTRLVPVIIMTAVYRGWRFAQDARETYGAEDYIEKPFHIGDLMRRIEQVVELSATRGHALLPSAEPQIAIGKELLAAGKHDEAVAAFEEAIGVDPFAAEAHLMLAKALRAKGEDFRAMTAYERAVELRPGALSALRSLAALYTEKGFRRKAAETLERALAADPDPALREAVKADLLKLL